MVVVTHLLCFPPSAARIPSVCPLKRDFSTTCTVFAMLGKGGVVSGACRPQERVAGELMEQDSGQDGGALHVQFISCR